MFRRENHKKPNEDSKLDNWDFGQFGFPFNWNNFRFLEVKAMRKLIGKVVLRGNPVSTSHIYYRRKGRGMFMSEEAKKLKEDYAWQAKKQWKQEAIFEPISVSIKLFFGDARKRDWDNFHKLTMDGLQGIVYNDDNLIKEATIKLGVDKKKPRTEISFYEI